MRPGHTPRASGSPDPSSSRTTLRYDSTQGIYCCRRVLFDLKTIRLWPVWWARACRAAIRHEWEANERSELCPTPVMSHKKKVKQVVMLVPAVDYFVFDSCLDSELKWLKVESLGPALAAVLPPVSIAVPAANARPSPECFWTAWGCSSYPLSALVCLLLVVINAPAVKKGPLDV